MRITMTATCAEDLDRLVKYAKGIEAREGTEVELVVDYRNEAKTYLINEDVMARYHVSRTSAQSIVNAVKAYCGDSLGKGKILPSELLAWERRSLAEQEAKR